MNYEQQVKIFLRYLISININLVLNICQDLLLNSLGLNELFSKTFLIKKRCLSILSQIYIWRQTNQNSKLTRSNMMHAWMNFLRNINKKIVNQSDETNIEGI